jgi:hypothetical protein
MILAVLHADRLVLAFIVGACVAFLLTPRRPR